MKETIKATWLNDLSFEAEPLSSTDLGFRPRLLEEGLGSTCLDNTAGEAEGREAPHETGGGGGDPPGSLPLRPPNRRRRLTPVGLSLAQRRSLAPTSWETSRRPDATAPPTQSEHGSSAEQGSTPRGPQSSFRPAMMSAT